MPFLSLHALAAARGDGLRPELLALFKRLAEASVEADCSPSPEPQQASEREFEEIEEQLS